MLSPTQKESPKLQSTTATGDNKQSDQSKFTVSTGDRPDAGKQKISKPDVSAKETGQANEMSLEEKEQMARVIVAGVLATVDRIDPVEYGILAQVEAATLLWDLDRDQANSLLKTGLSRLRELMDARAERKASDRSMTEKEEMSKLKASILRRIARLKPDLIRELAGTNTAGDTTQAAVVGDWTEEAEAILVAATEEIERNPILAAELLQQSLTFGVPAGLPDFLARLSRRDGELADQQIMKLLSQLRDSSVSPLFLINLGSFFLFDKAASAQLRERYFESLAARLRRDIRSDLPRSDLQDLLFASRSAAQGASAYPLWQAEFAQIASEFEALFAARAQPPPDTPPPRVVDISSLRAAAEDDTQDIAKTASQVKTKRDSKARDEEYRKLAISAAQKADVRLAEELLSKIEDEELRRKTSIGVYGPLVRKALSEGDWAQAKTQALKISDPLGRTLVVDWVVREMTGANRDKQLIEELYYAALAKLQQDAPTQDVGKSFLILAKSLSTMDPEGGFAAVNGAIFVLNKTGASRPFSVESAPPSELATWIKRTTPTLRLDEILDLTEMIGPVFKELSKHDVNTTQSLALALSHPGMRSLAYLGVARGLLEEVRSSRRPVGGGKTGPPDG
jgi:hypothetical protein